MSTRPQLPLIAALSADGIHPYLSSMGLWFIDHAGLQTAARWCIWQHRHALHPTPHPQILQSFLDTIETTFDRETNERFHLWLDHVYTFQTGLEGDPWEVWDSIFLQLGNILFHARPKDAPPESPAEALISAYTNQDGHLWLNEIARAPHAATPWDRWLWEHTTLTANESLAMEDENGDLFHGVWQTIAKHRFQQWWTAQKSQTPPPEWQARIAEIREIARTRIDRLSPAAPLPEPTPFTNFQKILSPNNSIKYNHK